MTAGGEQEALAPSSSAEPLAGQPGEDPSSGGGVQLEGEDGSEPQPVGQPLILWRVYQGPDRLVGYLHGSVHVLPGAHLGQEPHVDQAYADSDALVVEVDISTSQAALSLLTAQLGMYPSGQTLEDHIDADMLQQVQEQAAQYGVPLAAAMRMRPWLLALTLTAMRMSQEGFSQEYGVDRRFLAEAHGRGGHGKPVLALESAEEQLHLFADQPEDQQILFLKDALVRSGMDDGLRKILDAWVVGDVDALAEFVFAPLREDPSLAPYYETFFFRRNRGMASRLAALFESPQVYFVVIGTAHLVGDDSVVELLKQRGFRVEQVYVATEDDGTGATAEPLGEDEAAELEADKADKASAFPVSP